MKEIKWQFSIHFLVLTALFALAVSAAVANEKRDDGKATRATAIINDRHHKKNYHLNRSNSIPARATKTIRNCFLATIQQKKLAKSSGHHKLPDMQTVYVCDRSKHTIIVSKKHSLKKFGRHSSRKKSVDPKKKHKKDTKSKLKKHIAGKHKKHTNGKHKKHTNGKHKKHANEKHSNDKHKKHDTMIKHKNHSTSFKSKKVNTVTTTHNSSETPVLPASITAMTTTASTNSYNGNNANTSDGAIDSSNDINNNNDGNDEDGNSDDGNSDDGNNDDGNDEDGNDDAASNDDQDSAQDATSTASAVPLGAAADANASITTATPVDNNNQVSGQSINNGQAIENTPQSKIIGVSVGAVVGCLAAAGLAGMFIYKRKQTSQHDQDIEDLNQTSEVNTRWRTQSFMAVVAGTVAKLPKRSNSSGSSRSVGVLKSIRRAASNASSKLSRTASNRSSTNSYGIAISGPIPAIQRIDGDQAQYFGEPESPTATTQHHFHTHAY